MSAEAPGTVDISGFFAGSVAKAVESLQANTGDEGLVGEVIDCFRQGIALEKEGLEHYDRNCKLRMQLYCILMSYLAAAEYASWMLQRAEHWENHYRQNGADRDYDQNAFDAGQAGEMAQRKFNEVRRLIASFLDWAKTL